MSFEHIPDDEHILNFRKGWIERIPSWFIPIQENKLRVIIGPGDYVHEFEGRMKTNIEAFKEYDVFCCFGDNDVFNDTLYTSVSDNLQYLKTRHYHQKVMCIIDVYNELQMINFVDLFRDSCMIMTHQGGHSPNFKPEYSSACLITGGIVVQKTLHDNEIYKNFKELRKHGLICAYEDFIDPTGRSYKGSIVCTKIDYSYFNGGLRNSRRLRRTSRKTKLRRKTRKH